VTEPSKGGGADLFGALAAALPLERLSDALLADFFSRVLMGSMDLRSCYNSYLPTDSP
jgi:hypothetical protein